MHNSDILARALEYACVPKEAAARALVSKAWLTAYDAPALWRTLTLTALPTDAPVHCLVSAWARAPQRLRAVVERHTRCVTFTTVGPQTVVSSLKHHTPSAAVSQDRTLRVSRESL